MYNLILFLFLSVSQPIIIEKLAVLPKQLEVPKPFRSKQRFNKKVWYAKYF